METTNSIFEYIQAIEQSIDQWVEDNSPQKIKKEVHEELTKHQREVMLKLLGFDKRSYTSKSNAYTIDHCNGRNGNSVIGDYIQSAVKPAVEEFVSKFPLTITPSLEEKLRKEVEKEFETTLVYQVKKHFRDNLEKRIKEIQQNYLDATLAQYGIEKGKDPLEAYNNLMKLIGAKDNGA